MSDMQRGNTTHGPRLDEQMKQESRGMVQGHGAPHAEPFRESEPLPDDTDEADVERAFRHDTPRTEAGEESGADDEYAADAQTGADDESGADAQTGVDGATHAGGVRDATDETEGTP